MCMWLDETTREHAREIRAHLVANGRSEGALGRSDFEITRNIVIKASDNAIAATYRGGVASERAEYWSTICPFFLRPDELRAGLSPYACAIQSELCQQFIGAKVSAEVVRCALEFARPRFVISIDVAERAARLGTTHQVRAIFLTRIPRPERYLGARATEPWTSDATDELRFLAIVTPVGRFDRSHIRWSADSDNRPHYEYNDDAADFANILKSSGTAIDDAVADIENLAWLTLAYASVAEPSARQIVPTATDEERAAPGRAARRRARHFSLFRVERLRSPADRFGHDGKDTGRDGTQLGRRIGVRGHFKMQRYGRANSLRKLIYVVGHFRGPMNAPPLHSLHHIERPSSAAAAS